MGTEGLRRKLNLGRSKYKGKYAWGLISLHRETKRGYGVHWWPWRWVWALTPVSGERLFCTIRQRHHLLLLDTKLFPAENSTRSFPYHDFKPRPSCSTYEACVSGINLKLTGRAVKKILCIVRIQRHRDIFRRVSL